MKKLLLVLLVVTLASFLFVGCLPVTPAEGEGEGEGEGEAGICPTVAVTSQVAVGGKNYIKGGEQTITVTFAVPTEPVSVFVGGLLKAPDLTPVEVVMYADATKTVYTGTYDFGSVNEQECGEAYIYVETCDTCDYCKYPYTVDTLPPTAKIEICSDGCDCEGCELSFTSTSGTECDVTTENCDDACSGFASWSIDIYDVYPFDTCCDVPCETPIASDSGVCPIDFTTACLTEVSTPVFAVITLVDNVGNDVRWMVEVEVTDYDTCEEITITPYTSGPGITAECLDVPPEGTFTECVSE